ncbi:hypothetical protein VTI74DRAFT_3606 [Chaetomium olivicolor]
MRIFLMVFLPRNLLGGTTRFPCNFVGRMFHSRHTGDSRHSAFRYPERRPNDGALLITQVMHPFLLHEAYWPTGSCVHYNRSPWALMANRSFPWLRRSLPKFHLPGSGRSRLMKFLFRYTAQAITYTGVFGSNTIVLSFTASSHRSADGFFFPAYQHFSTGSAPSNAPQSGPSAQSAASGSMTMDLRQPPLGSPLRSRLAPCVRGPQSQ